MKNKIIKGDLDYIISLDLPWDMFRNKTVLITGITGLIPAYMVYTLLYLNEVFNLDINVIGISRNEIKIKSKFKDYLNNKNFSYLVQDVCQPLKIKDKIDFVIHAASIATPKYYESNPVDVINANVIGTNNLLKLAKDNNVELFAYFSSGAVYGCIDKDKIPFKEDEYGYIDPLEKSSCYSESKRLGEAMCKAWMNQYDVPIIIIRPSHTYGPGIDLKDGRVFADFVENVLNGDSINLYSDGSAVRQFCYLADATSAFYTIMLKGIRGEAYNVGTDDGIISIYDLATKLVKAFPEKNLKVILREQCDKNFQRSNASVEYSDINKLKNLGWKSTYSIEKGFKRTIKSFKY